MMGKHASIFDELLPEDQKLALNIVKLLKKNKDEKNDGNAGKHLTSKPNMVS
jgi:hypothetical protein